MIRDRQADGWTDRRKDTTTCKDAKSLLKRFVSPVSMTCIVNSWANLGDSENKNPFHFNKENHKLEKLREGDDFGMVYAWQ